MSMVVQPYKLGERGGIPVKKSNGKKLKAPARPRLRRTSRGSVLESPLRYLPWLLLTVILHVWLFVYPLPEEGGRPGLSEKRAKVAANILKLKALQEQLEEMRDVRTAAVQETIEEKPEGKNEEQPLDQERPEEKPPEEETPKEDEKKPPIEQSETKDPDPKSKEDPDTVPTEETPETKEAQPERTKRKEIEGQETETETKENEASEAQANGEEQAPPDNHQPAEEQPESSTTDREVSASELARSELQAVFQEPQRAGGHFGVAWSKWQKQAAAKRKAASSSGARGEAEGLPQLGRAPITDPRVLISGLELFGGEIVMGSGADSWVHFVRTGDQFEARYLTQSELDRMAAARGLNYGFITPLVDELDHLPKSLLAARQVAMRDARFDQAFYDKQPSGVRLGWVGTTREQSLVSERAQTYLRRNRTKYPQYRYWHEAQMIDFAYRIDEANGNAVYDIEIENIR